jgi:hypothetical protein
MKYKKAYTYFLNGSRGTPNLLSGSLLLASTMIIPIIGQMIWLGFQTLVVRTLEKDRDPATLPRFDSHRISEYISLGVNPFVMSLIVGIISAFAGMVISGLGIFVVSMSREPLAYLTVILPMIPVIVGLTLYTIPMVLFAQLQSKGLRIRGAFRFAHRMVRLIWPQMLVTIVIHYTIAMVLGTAGLLCCCVGIFPAQVVILMAQDHLALQLYDHYLERGGVPIGEEPEPDFRDDDD